MLDVVHVRFALPRDQHRRLKARAATEGKPLATFVRELAESAAGGAQDAAAVKIEDQKAAPATQHNG